MSNSYFTNNNMYNFDLTIKSIFGGAKKPTESSFSKWIERAQLVREAILENRREHADELRSMEGTWATNIIDQKRTQFREEEAGVAKIAREMILSDLENIFTSKEAKYREAMSAPSEEQLRLLSILQMRVDSGEELSSSDFANVTPFCVDNYHCLKQLSNIAKNSEVPFPRIEDTFKSDVDTAREAANELLRSIDKPKESLKYHELDFWTTGNAGLYQKAFDNLDNPRYLDITPETVVKAAVDKNIKEEARKNDIRKTNSADDGSAKFCSKVKLNGTEDIYVIADQFHVSVDEIAKLNPGKSLDHLYGGQEILIPSTRFSYSPGSSAAVQENQIELAQKPVFPDPVGPHGARPGDDIDIVADTFD